MKKRQKSPANADPEVDETEAREAAPGGAAETCDIAGCPGFVVGNLGLSLRGKEVEDLPHHALSLVRLKEKLSVHRAL